MVVPRCLLFVPALCLGYCSTCGAQQTTLQLADAISIAISNSPRLAAGRSTVSRERSRLYQVTRKPNPIIGYAASEVGNGGSAGQQGLFVSQQFRTANKLGLNGAVQRRAITVSSLQLSVLELQTTLRVHLQYLDVAYYRERARLLEKLQKSLDDATASVQELFNSGEVGKFPLLQARLESGRNRAFISQNAALLSASRHALATLLYQSIDQQWIDSSPLFGEVQPPSNEQAWEQITNSSPELMLARARYHQTIQRVRRECVEPVPDLQTQWMLQQDTDTNDLVVGVQIGVELPVHDKNTGAINAARADLRRTHSMIDAVRQQIENRLASTLGSYRRGWVQLESTGGTLQELAVENLEATQQAFAAGEATYLDLLNAQRSFITLNQQSLAARVEIAKASAKLSALVVSLP